MMRPLPWHAGLQVLLLLTACGPTEQPSRIRTAVLEAQRQEALARGDYPEAARLGLARNLEIELQTLVNSGAPVPEARIKLEAKYRRLATLADRQLATGREEALSAVVYSPGEVEEAAKVAQDFGDLYLGDPGAATLSDEVSADMPWSGYWYPTRGKELFFADSSPLAKLDRAAARNGTPSQARLWQEQQAESALADSWEGHCGSWALASSTTKEPQRPVTALGETFSVADQKALLTLVHENYPSTQYGSRYLGNATTDGTFQDLRPEAFHQLAAVLLGQQRRAFVIDTDPGVEVWSRPVFRYRWVASRDPGNPDALHVQAFPWMTHERSAEADDPTTTADRAGPVYEYRLYLDQAVRADGKRHVIAGEWLGAAWKAHPDFALVPAQGAEWQAANPELTKDMAIIKDIARQGQ